MSIAAAIVPPEITCPNCRARGAMTVCRICKTDLRPGPPLDPEGTLLDAAIEAHRLQRHLVIDADGHYRLVPVVFPGMQKMNAVVDKQFAANHPYFD